MFVLICSTHKGQSLTKVQVDELWESMCQSSIALIEKALPAVDNDEKLLKIKGVIALFVQTMDVRGDLRRELLN